MPNENRPDESGRTAGSDDRLRDANEQLTLATLRAQEQSAESAERYRALVEGLDAIVWEAHTDPWRFTFVSRQAQAILGYPVERWLTEPTFWMDGIHPEDRPLAVSICTESAAARRDFRVEYRAIASDGRIVWSALIARLRQVDQGPAQYRGLILNVGDSIRAETLEQLVAQQTAELLGKQDHLQALTTELNLAEHRERTRLSAELHDHLAQMLVLGRLKLGQAKRVTGVEPECADLIQQTDDVLCESLAYTRTLIADLSPPVLREFGLLAALHWLTGQMQRYRLAIRIDAQDSSEPPISEDRAVLLFQSVREMLINVSKHARTGRATVSLRRQSGNVLRLDVRDEGCGFNVADVAINNKTATALKFGLFTIRERMKALGGAFEVDSAPGEGTTATLILPMSARTEANQGSVEPPISRQFSRSRSSPSTHGSPQDHRRSPIGVLLVDDHAMLRQGLRSIVDGHHDLRVVGEASNGLEAIDAVRALKPDVVVMDINMPEMNGIEATKRIKEEFPDTAVIGLSVHQGTNIAQTMADAGISKYLTKESAVEALCQAIEDAVSEKR